jgi:DNA polymerase-3 subunit gamma/tau
MEQLAITMRPRKIQDVYGQAPVKKEIEALLKSKEWPTAMLFKGPSGTGKSTVAYLVAAAIVCENPDKDGNPCGQCAPCKAVISESFDRDVTVLNANETGGKSDIVELTRYADTTAFYDKAKVILIEEADSLSAAGKAALLKLLERPRKGIHFILLSMFNGGLPPPIQSRCQTFLFKPFTTKDIMFALKELLVKMNLWDEAKLPKTFMFEGLATIASSAKGSLREAVQYLQKCLTGQVYTKEEIRDNLGLLDESSLKEALFALLDKKASEFYKCLGDMDVTDFFNLSYTILTDALVYKMTEISKNDFYEETNKALAAHSRLRQLTAFFDELSKESRPYLRKAYFIGKTADWFMGRGGIATAPVRQSMMNGREELETRPVNR